MDAFDRGLRLFFRWTTSKQCYALDKISFVPAISKTSQDINWWQSCIENHHTNGLLPERQLDFLTESSWYPVRLCFGNVQFLTMPTSQRRLVESGHVS
jgi:hypothetical protein